MTYRRIKQLFYILYIKFINLVYCHKIVILLGERFALINIYYRNNILENIILENKDINYHDNEFQQLIKRYPYAKLYLMIDDPEIVIKYVSLTSFESLINKDIISKYAVQEFNNNQLYAHKRLSSNSDGAIQSLFALFNFNKITELLFDIIFQKQQLLYGGIYFVPLEISSTINNISRNCLANDQYADFATSNIQIFVFVSEVSEIRLIVLQDEKILLNKYAKYPVGRSIQYICGTIEQEINEVTLSASHLADHDPELNISLALIASTDITEILRNTKFNKITGHNIIDIAKLQQIKDDFSKINSKYYFDIFLANLLFQQRNFMASNHHLNDILNLNVLNKVSNKIFLYISLFLILIVGCLNVAVYTHNINLDRLNEAYFTSNLEYNNIKENFPDAQIFDQLAELIFLNNVLKHQQISPVQLIQTFMTIQPANVQINYIDWHKSDIKTNNDKFITEINLQYMSQNRDEVKITQDITDYIAQLRQNFKKYDIIYTKNFNNIDYKISHTTTPMSITISN